MKLLALLTIAVSAIQIAFCAFLPVSPLNETALLKSRADQARDGLQPKDTIELSYIEESADNATYLFQTTFSHENSSYIVVENFEHLLVDLACASLELNNASKLIFAFGDTELVKLAQEIWAHQHEPLFITQHRSCNAFDERGFYKANSISYDLENLLVIVTARALDLEESSEAYSRLRIEGKPLSHDISKLLRHRDDLERIRETAKNTLSHSHWILDLEDHGRLQFHQPRDNIIRFGDFSMTCVNCTLTGKIAVTFEFDTFLSFKNKGKPFELAVLNFTTVEKIEGKYNIEIKSTANLFFDCTFPGCFEKQGPVLGDRFTPSKTFSSKKVAGLTLDLGFSLGVSIGLNVKTSAVLTFPITINAPANKTMTKHFFGNASDTNELLHHIKPHLGTPRIAESDIKGAVCPYFAVGPAIALAIGSKRFGIAFTTMIDLPRVKACATSAYDVNLQCKKGSFERATQVTADIGAGLVAFWRSYAKAFLGIEVSDVWKSLNTTKTYRKYPFYEKCFEL